MESRNGEMLWTEDDRSSKASARLKNTNVNRLVHALHPSQLARKPAGRTTIALCTMSIKSASHTQTNGSEISSCDCKKHRHAGCWPHFMDLCGEYHKEWGTPLQQILFGVLGLQFAIYLWYLDYKPGKSDHRADYSLKCPLLWRHVQLLQLTFRIKSAERLYACLKGQTEKEKWGFQGERQRDWMVL